MMSGGCSKLIGVFFALLFIIAFATGLTFNYLESRIFQPDAYLEGLQEGKLADRLTEVISGELAESLGNDPCSFTLSLCSETGGAPGYLIQLGAAEWKQILDQLITPDWVQGRADSIVRGVFAAFNSDTPEAKVPIELGTIKGKLEGEAGARVVGIVLSSMPLCTPEQIVQLGQDLVTGGSIDQLLICSPPPELSELIVPILRQELATLADELPDEIVVNPNSFGVSGESESGLAFNRIRESIHWGSILAFVIAAGCLLFAFAFTVRSLREFFFWAGWPLFSAGLVTTAISIGVRSTTALIISPLLSMTNMTILQPETLDFIGDLLQAVIRSLFSGMLLISIGIAGVGAGLMIVSRLFPGRPEASGVGPRPENLY
jgi:hypothetical protein